MVKIMFLTIILSFITTQNDIQRYLFVIEIVMNYHFILVKKFGFLLQNKFSRLSNIFKGTYVVVLIVPDICKQ